ncbi:endosomal cargo receptor (Erp3) [Ceratobasidium sp. AG-Ba]|nr:endosomal cargo receptor (Erp3) [Ceratobasidium sp. AG-Ba]QRV95574.1 endosomal cargo receptor (Erp3) [Ceratobasidium sp. AG-Ba]
MRPVTILALLAGAAASVNASALTTTIPPNQRLCFFADVDKEGEKIGTEEQVQSGGDFDIDFEVKDPAGDQLLDGQRERQGDFIFTANKVGEYSFCFENDMSSFTEKLIDFDIMVESEPRREAPAKPGQISDHTSALEESIYKLKSMLATVERTQKFFHTRENRGFSLVKSTRNKLFWYAILESVAIVSMAVAQVYVLQNFFIGTGRKYRV